MNKKYKETKHCCGQNSFYRQKYKKKCFIGFLDLEQTQEIFVYYILVTLEIIKIYFVFKKSNLTFNCY